MTNIEILIDFDIRTYGHKNLQRREMKNRIHNYVNKIFKQRLIFKKNSIFEIEIEQPIFELKQKNRDLDNIAKIILDGIKNTNVFPFDDSAVNRLILHRTTTKNTILKIKTVSDLRKII
jgi:Holliday junction resolvase RusA-like endonuclease